jgi:phosphate transport system permease protein
MAAVIANQFTEAADELYLHALVEIGLVLFIVTVAINACSRLLIWRVGGTRRVRAAGPRPARAA